MEPQSSKVTTSSVVIQRGMAVEVPFSNDMITTALVPHIITAFTTFLQSGNYASVLKCHSDCVQNEQI